MTKYDPWQGDDNSNYPKHDNDEKHHNSQHTTSLQRAIIFILSLLLLVAGLAIAFPQTSLSDPYLVRGLIIVSIFGGIAAYWSRSTIGRIAKNIGLWGVIILGLSIFYLYKSELSEEYMAHMNTSDYSQDSDVIKLKRARDGNFWITVNMNDTPVNLIIDTGATNVVLSPQDAKAIGLHLDELSYNRFAETANGRVAFAKVIIDEVRVGDRVLKKIPVTINGSPMKGSLLGNSLLRKYRSIEIQQDIMFLKP